MAPDADLIVGAAADAAGFLRPGVGRSAFESALKAAVDVLARFLVRYLGIGRPALDVHHHLAPAHGGVDQSLPVKSNQ